MSCVSCTYCFVCENKTIAPFEAEQGRMICAIVLFHSILFTLEKSNRIILEYKTMRRTSMSLDLAKPSYNFIIYLKLATKEVVRSPTISFYFV